MRPLTIIAALGTAGGVLAACAAPVAPDPASASGTTPQNSTPPAPVIAQAAPQAKPLPQGLRIILRLKDRQTPVNSQQTLDRLGALCAAQLTYVRAMSDDAHVLILTPGPGMSADEALGLLRSSRIVDYVEPDAVRRALPSR